MEELKLSSALATVQHKNLDLWLGSLKLGQVLRMTVADKLSSGAVLLRVGAVQVTATSDIPVQKGEVLTLQVNGLNPAPNLKIINTQVPGVVQADPLVGYLKVLMPSQGLVIAPLLTLIDSARNANILSLLGMRRGDLERNYKILTPSDLTTGTGALKKAVQQSGLFLESQLLALLGTGKTLPPGDLKAALLRLLGRVNGVLPQLQRNKHADPGLQVLLSLRDELEGALATITLKQLNVAQTEGKCWSFEIPFRIQNTVCSVALRIEREHTPAAATEESEQQDWNILLNVDLPQLGAVEAELFMRGSKVSVVIYAEQAETAEQMNGSLDELKSGLESRGLNVSVLLCHQAKSSAAQLDAQGSVCVREEV